jgi:Na+/proline symporter
VVLILGLPSDVSTGQALALAGATGRMTALDFSFDPKQTYTFWSGIIGGLFLMLSYFGCDQSQVQRYLTARSEDEGRESLMMSAYVKIPLQALVLVTGVLVFAFYLFATPPMLFNPVYESRVRASTRADEYAGLERQFAGAVKDRQAAAEAFARAGSAGDVAAHQAARARFRSADEHVSAVRTQAATLVKEVTGDRAYNDVNYVFPTFVITHMPVGIVGLIIAAIFAAAMSASAGELNALGTSTVIDVYRRHIRKDASDAHYLLVSKVATGAWGLVACSVAVYAANQGSLIEVVNRFGSYFYGSLLGVFVLAMGTRRATGRGAFWGLAAGMVAVVSVAASTTISFLWYNVVGAIVVIVVGLALSLTDRPGSRQPTAGSRPVDG